MLSVVNTVSGIFFTRMLYCLFLYITVRWRESESAGTTPGDGKAKLDGDKTLSINLFREEVDHLLKTTICRSGKSVQSDHSAGMHPESLNGDELPCNFIHTVDSPESYASFRSRSRPLIHFRHIS